MLPSIAIGGILLAYGAVLLIAILFGLHRYWLLAIYLKNKNKPNPAIPDFRTLPEVPFVTVQLPLFNEVQVAERLIDAACRLEYPREKFEVQVLDDSTDNTVSLVQSRVEWWKKNGINIHHIHRTQRAGYKAGALQNGMGVAKGELMAIFDADFVPPADFLTKLVPHFLDPGVGAVQARWGHINASHSLLTRLQSLFLDGHFIVEHSARSRSGAFFNFNGTAGILRKTAIVQSGGWSADTLTEDLDLSYRAQLAGWRFIYRPDVVCSAELPVDIMAFRHQQRRWSKGAVQVARKLLRPIWRSNQPLHVKVESTAHLLGNLGYPLTLGIAFLLFPSLLVRPFFNFPGVEYIELVAFLLSMGSITLFYGFTLREISSNWSFRLKEIPALLSFGIGMCLSNSLAVIEGLRGRKSEFVRTAKYGVRDRGDTWTKHIYARRESQSDWGLLFFSIYSMLTLLMAVVRSNFGALPFISLFVIGFSYVAILSYVQRNLIECQ